MPYVRPIADIIADLRSMHEEIKYFKETRPLAKEFAKYLVELDRVEKVVSSRAPKLDFSKAVRSAVKGREPSPYNLFVREQFAGAKEKGESITLTEVAEMWHDKKLEQ